MWAFGCGVASAHAGLAAHWPLALLGVVLAGPLVCAMSQAANDWYDRHVDAINEPHRPIPSGRIPGRWGFYIALFWTGLSLIAALPLGTWGFGATIIAIALAWAYSAPPLRLKANGWWGNLACGLAYETLPWITAAAIMSGGAPDWRVLLVALLYGLGAHGIMTLNDFKAIEGDRRMGILSLPVQLGAERAGLVACIFMAVPQVFRAVMRTQYPPRLKGKPYLFEGEENPEKGGYPGIRTLIKRLRENWATVEYLLLDNEAVKDLVAQHSNGLRRPDGTIAK
jgi:chlorophyll synthase